MKTNSLDFDAQVLREKILDLAMRGKLVKQDPNDEPASVLLEKIKAEKAELVKEGKIKKSKALPEITDDEKPFDIPDSWEWVRLGEVFDVTSSKRVMKKEWQNEGIPFYRAREIVSIKNNRPLKDPIFLNESTYNEKIKVSGVPKVNDILLTGVGTLGIPYIVKDNKKFYFKDGNIIWLKNISDINSQYLSYYIQSPYMVKEINNGRGTTVATLTIIRAKDLMIPLPPLPEQSRIAAKIAQLFALLLKVESSTQQYAKLQTLLKSKVLDLAMRGKLIKQDPNDEPASVLLEKIKAEKAELVKEKKIKKSKPLPEITDDEKPFDIPDSWEWGRLGDICLSNIGLTYKPSQKSEKPTKTIILRANNVEANELNKENVIFLDIDNLKEKYYLKENDILMAVRSGSKRLVGKSAVVTPQFVGFSFGAFMSKIRILSANSWYVDYFLNSAAFRSQLGDANTTTINQITQGMINNFVLPLPPLSEQNRIAAKIAQLFALLRKDESSN